MRNKAIEILQLAMQQKIEISLEGDQLRLKLPKNTDFDKNILQSIKDHKEEIIDFLRSNAEINKIEKAEITVDQRYPLSFSQERLWFLDRLEGSLQYHMPSVFNLKGKLDIDILSSTLTKIIERQQVFRTIFEEEDGRVYQKLIDYKAWTLDKKDGSGIKDDKIALKKMINQLVVEPFDLSKDFMFRACLITLAPDDYILVATMHHIASDGWSRSVLVKEIIELYTAYSEKRDYDLPSLDLQYVDFSVWQRNYLQGEVLERKLAYWKKKLNGVSPLQLPTDFKRPLYWSTKGATELFTIDKTITDELLNFSRKNGCTLFMTLLSAFKVLMYRHSGQQDICIGTPSAGRNQKELEDLIGFFVNTLAIRSEVNGQSKFTDFLQNVKTSTIEAFEHQDVPFERIVDEVSAERNLNRNPLFQVMFNLLNTPEIPKLQIGDVELSRDIHEPAARFDLEFYVTENPNGLSILVEYCADLFQAETVKRFLNHYTFLLRSILSNPDEKLGFLPMLSEEETKTIFSFNGKKANYPANETVVSAFAKQAKQTPDAIAVQFEGQTLTYSELNKRSNQLANYLRKQGVKEETLVPICLDRSFEMMVGIWGILKAGAAYVPVDPEYPADRIQYILKDTDAKVLLGTKEAIGKIEFPKQVQVLLLDEDWSKVAMESGGEPQNKILSQHVAFVIYTSGSTGQPKGTLNEHGALWNSLSWAQEFYKLTPEDAILQKTTFCFDVSIWELLWPIMVGSRLVLAKPGGQKDTVYLKNIIEKENITHVLFVPSMLGILLKDLEPGDCLNLKKVLCSGEALRPSHLEDFNEKLPHAEIHNLYGPTEAAIHVTHWMWTDRDRKLETVPIGKPLANTDFFLLDENDNLSPLGGIGQIHIGGVQVARGYLNRPELTEEKFVRDPFNDAQNARLYKTGDLGRWLPDGNLEYLGRIDDQVKIRGFRIELGEVERALNNLPQIKTNGVVARQDFNGINKLVSYYVPENKAIKEKEHELYQAQVSNWKNLYEIEYAQTENDSDVNPEFNLIGWNDSFSGGPIPEPQMKAWIDDIVERVLSENPKNILEIGCGTGLIYFQLAGKVQKYIGTDFSSSSISQVKQHIDKKLRDYGPTELFVAAAHEVKLNEKVDTILLNSIIQYFPGEEYMNEVFKNCLSILNNEGCIVIGDVRDLRLLRSFKARLELNKMQQTVNLNEFNWAVEQDLLKEEELCFSPEYFYDLQKQFPQITHVDIQWKQADYINELSLYRYNVVVYVGKKPELIEPEWKVWDASLNEKSILELLKKGGDSLAITDLPNPRLYKEHQLRHALANKSLNQVGDILNFVELEDPEISGIIQIFNSLTSAGYKINMYLDENPLLVNAYIHKSGNANQVKSIYGEISKEKTEFSNIPLFNDISLLLQKEIREAIQHKLPEYMVPSDLIALLNLPLNSNGKIDRKFLTEREDIAVTNRLNYQPATTELEHKLVDIWQELLRHDRIGVLDNFFQLGGHSLLIIRLISAVRKQLEIELDIKDLFNYPTISELSNFIEGNEGQDSKLPPLEDYDRPELIPLSFGQNRLWFIDKIEDSTRYNVPSVLRLKGNLNVSALEMAIGQLLKRHEVLRTVIKEIDGEGYQFIKPFTDWKLKITDASKKTESELKTLIQQKINLPFDLSKDDMMRVELLSLTSDDYVLVVTMHHIASDAWSASVLVNDIVELYNGFDQKREPNLTDLEVQYADYAIWQSKYLAGQVLDQKIEYWKQKLEGTPALEIPTDFKRPAIQSVNGSHATSKIDKATADKLKDMSQQQGTTLFMTMLAALKVLLYRYSGQDDICVGTPIAGRQHKELESLIGYFVNTLALRTQLNEDSDFIELLQNVKTTTLEAYQHQDAPFEKVVEAVVKQRDPSRSPLFQVMFTLQNAPEVPELKLGDVKLSGQSYSFNSSKFEMTFYVGESEDGFNFTIEYCTDLFSLSTIQRLQSHFATLLRSIVSDPHQKLSMLSMLDEKEEQVLLTEFNSALHLTSAQTTFVERFEKQVEKTPQAAALVFGDELLTYTQLNERSNQLAHYLVSKGVKPQTLVPICVERSAEMLIGILGILKSGGAYVPMDAEYPQARIDHILSDTKATLVLSDRASSQKLNHKLLEVVDITQAIPNNQANSNLTLSNLTLNDPAYVIYTSGSTGLPKGVVISHGNMMHYLGNSQVNYVNPNTKSSGSFMLLSYTFDASVTGLFLPLLYGKTVVIGSKTSVDVFEDSNLHKYAPYDFIKLTPSHLELLQPKLHKSTGELITQKLVVGGEALLKSQVDYLLEQSLDIEIINEYGPTESTVGCSTYRFNTSKTQELKHNLPIGVPIDNVQMYIVNANNVLCPVGVPGEICIAGYGLAQGYLNNPKLTGEKFTDNPFVKGTTIYRTGDLARWTSDGTIEFLGRTDDQVKIRGYRVELGEIETWLSSQQGIRSSKVVLDQSETTDDKRLNAYLQVDKDKLPLLSSYEHMLGRKKIQKSDLHILPNGLPILNSNLNEVRFLYQEIFEDHCYLKHGISFSPDSVVVDIGANAGFFNVFLSALSKDITIYSFEPIPEVYHYLTANRELYGVKGKAFQLAVLDEEKEIDFNYFPQVTIVSGISDDRIKVKDVVRSYIENSGDGVLNEQEMEALLESKLESKRIVCQTKTLSQIIAQENIQRIDLLKVDVENSEHLVMNGILEKDWDKIQSVIIEVHDLEGRLDQIKDKLEEKGFKTFVEKEEMLSKDDILYNLFALRTDKPNSITTLGDRDVKRSKEWQHPADVIKQVRAQMEESLPEYMVPAHIMLLDQFPLTSNGKIDKRALPKPEGNEYETAEYKEAENELEQTLVKIWQNLLEIDQVGIHDDFFDIGGHSLMAVRLISAIRKELAVEMSINDVFDYPTIAKLSEKIESQTQTEVLPSIKVQSRPRYIPLSFSQERLWFIDKLEGSVQYHIPSVLRLKGELNTLALEKSIKTIIDRHEVLRTVLKEQEGTAYQSIRSSAEWKLTKHTELNPETTKHDRDKYIQSLINKPFDLSKDYMLRADLLELEPQDHVLVVTLHHIASDGWSTSVLVKEVVALYNAIDQGKTPDLKALPVQYADYSLWQRNYLQGEVLENKLNYWKQKLDGVSPLELPIDKLRPAIISIKGTSKSFKIDKELSEKLTRFNQKADVTMFMTMLAAYNVILHRYSKQEDICVGIPIAGRQHQELEDLIGYFLNTLALRNQVPSTMSFNALLKQVKTTTMEAFAHQEVPFEKIIEAIVKERDMSRSAIFQTMFAYQNMPDIPALKLGNVHLSYNPIEQNTVKFELILNISESSDGMVGAVQYCTDLFNESTIDGFISHFNELLQSIVSQPDKAISELNLIGVKETVKLEQFNNNKVEYPTDLTIVDLIEKQVKLTPDAVAVVYENQSLTYQQLNERSNQLALYLQSKGIGVETLVPICIERSIEMIVGILGILKSGAAYVPIDPEYPQDRIDYMLEDTGAKLVLTDSTSLPKLNQKHIEFVDITKALPTDKQTNNLTLNNLTSKNLAYVIYTSGSTGKPKGVMNQHDGLVNRLLWAQDHYGLTPKDSVLQKTTFSFDVSVWELLWPLLAGAKLVFAKPGGHKDAEYLKEVIDQHNITMMHFVPSMLEVFLTTLNPGDCASLTKVLCSGEALGSSQVKEFREKLPATRLHNLYGPTEAAIDVTYWSDSPDQNVPAMIPIGKPVANTSIHILDGNGKVNPIGIAGEIHIGGIQVARGYLNRAELTAEKFIKDPLSSHGKLYRTGDLGRWLDDGNIEYLGRIDDQVKIRGYRIELGEIEVVMNSLNGVKNAKVIATENQTLSDKKINAYLQVDKEKYPLLSNYENLLQTKQINATDLHVLPNGLPILNANLNEVKFLYKEIFEDHCYLKHGITLNSDSCVIDVGANTGFLNVFLNTLSQDIKVYSFEPIPEVFDYLTANRALYNIKGKAFQMALLDTEQEIEFNYFPGMSIVSSISDDRNKVKDVVRSYIENTEEGDLLPEEMESLLEAKLESKKISCHATTLSQIIKSEGLNRIDLLKVDVENSEHLVIKGIAEGDWNKIQNVIIEIHDINGRLNEIQDLLEKHGFNTYIEKEELLSKDAVLYNIYASRKGVKNTFSSLSDKDKVKAKEWIHPADLVKNLRSELSSKLPEFMVPSHFVLLDNYPLTPNGKIDRKALPDPDFNEGSTQEYVAPQTILEQQLVEIWQKLLNITPIGINHNFFEMGGHSLLAMRVISAVRKSLGQELNVKDLFNYPTVSKLASYLTSGNKGTALPAIQKADRPVQIPLSFSQERLWFIHKLEGSLQYHIPSVLQLKGNLNKAALEKAVQTIVERHEVLRTVIRESDGIGYQLIKEPGHTTIAVEDGTKMNEKALNAYIRQQINQPFDLGEDLMLRVELLQRGANEHILIVVLHHIASDGWSTSLLVNEVVTLYNAFDKGTDYQLPELEIQYADYALWQRNYLQGDILNSKIEYWKNKLESVSPLELPTDKPRPALQSMQGGSKSFKIDKEVTAQLTTLSQKQGATMFMTMMSVIKVLLHKYSGQEDICVGTPIAGRQQHEVESLIGYFINTLAIRDQISGKMGFEQVLSEVKNTTLQAYDHQEAPFEKVVETIVKQRDISRSPLFQVMFVYQNTPEVPEIQLGDVKLLRKHYEPNTSQFDLIFTVSETTNGMSVTIHYCTDLYFEETIERMVGHFNKLVQGIVSNPAAQIGSLQMLTNAEESQILEIFNTPLPVLQEEQNILEMFANQVKSAPDAIALEFENRTLTYAELDKRANQLASYLLAQGINKNTPVPLCIERGLDMFVGILGILKTGSSYVPVDPEYPHERIAFILDDLKASIIISSKATKGSLSQVQSAVIVLDEEWETIEKQSEQKKADPISPNNLAYIIYTSGSTGKPKGVMVEHGQLYASTLARNEYYHSVGSVFLVPSFSFDSSVAVIFGTLTLGGRLLVCKDADIKSAEAIKQLTAKADTILCVPSYYRYILDEGLLNNSALSKVILAGEKLDDELVDRHFSSAPNIELYNEYGPTENTVWSTVQKIKVDEKVSIGKPIPGVNVYITDSEGHLCAVGIPGELVTGGMQVSRGYLNNPKLTAEKFVNDPFNHQKGDRMYKTGDLARWLTDGSIEYLGRIDDQVKIRGFRVEPGEIEAAILQSELVMQAVVIAKEDLQKTARLIAYVVPKKGYDPEQVQKFLRTTLPQHMIPSLIMELDKIPLTPNGKVDKKALPDPDLSEQMRKQYVAPTNATEQMLAEIWQEILGIEKVGIHDNFFELGGHSLMALRIISAIRRECEAELEIIELVTHPYISEIAEIIQQRNLVEKS